MTPPLTKTSSNAAMPDSSWEAETGSSGTAGCQAVIRT